MSRNNNRTRTTGTRSATDDDATSFGVADFPAPSPNSVDLSAIMQGQAEILAQLNEGQRRANEEQRRLNDLLSQLLLGNQRPTNPALAMGLEEQTIEAEPVGVPTTAAEPVQATPYRGSATPYRGVSAPPVTQGASMVPPPPRPDDARLNVRSATMEPTPEPHFPALADDYRGGRDTGLKIKPPEWDGSEATLEDFLDQCELSFEANPAMFATDARRITLAIGYMTGAPRTRLRNLRQSTEYNSFLHNWNEFCEDLRSSYGDPHPGVTARHQLTNLRQGKTSVTAHAAEFNSLAARANATDKKQLLALFEQSLRPSLRKALAGVPMDDLAAFINAAINVERRMQMIHEAGDHMTMSTPASRARRSPTHSAGTARPQRQSSTSKEPSRESADRLRQDRRTKGNCYTCGDPNHFQRDCPKGPQAQQLRAHAIRYDEDGSFVVNPMDSEGESEPSVDLSEESTSEKEN